MPAANFIDQSGVDTILNEASTSGAHSALGSSTDRGPVNNGVQAYDFLRSRRISKDRRNALNALHQRFCLSLQALFTSRLRQTTDVSIASVEQATFGEFLMSLSTPCSAFVFDLGDGTGIQGVMDFGTSLPYQLVDRLFGGPGTSGDLNRPLTHLERLVITGVVDLALQYFGEAWRDYSVPFTPKQIGFEALPDQLVVANREDAVLVSIIHVQIGDRTSVITVGLPLIALEAFLQEKRSAVVRTAKVDPSDREAARADVETAVRQAHVPLTVRFPTFTLSARDVASLAEGQVIQTGLPLDATVDVRISGRIRFVATPGQVRRGAGVRILQVLPSDFSEPMPRRRARVL